MSKQALYLHKIDEYTVMPVKGRFLSQAEIAEWGRLQEEIEQLERMHVGAKLDQNDGPHLKLMMLRKHRDALGLIVPGDYGIDERPAALLADALDWYVHESQEAVLERNDLEIAAAGKCYDPAILMAEVNPGDSEHYAALDVVNALQKPVLTSLDGLKDIIGALASFAADEINRIDDETYADTFEPLLSTLRAIAERLGDNAHCLLTTDGDLVNEGD